MRSWDPLFNRRIPRCKLLKSVKINSTNSTLNFFGIEPKTALIEGLIYNV